MTDLIIGCFNNYTYHNIQPWVESLDKVNYTGLKAVIVSNVDDELVKLLETKKFIVVNKGRIERNSNIVVDRFFDVSEFVEEYNSQNPKLRYVISTDVRDVIFQKNPIEWLENNLGDFEVVASGEGIKYQDEPWSKNNIILSFGEEQYEKMKDEEINCAGVIAGTSEAIVRLFREVWSICQGREQFVRGGGGPDQSAYNILLRQQYDMVKVLYVNNDRDWAVQLGTTIPAIKSGSGDIGIEYKKRAFGGLYLDELKPKLLSQEPKLVDKVIVNFKDEPYYIVHQYDRVPEWANKMFERDTISLAIPDGEITNYIYSANYNANNRVKDYRDNDN